MSIALGRNNGIEGSPGFIRGISCVPIYEGMEITGNHLEEKRLPARDLAAAPVLDDPGKAGIGRGNESSSCSSSIGRNSDSSPGAVGSDGEDSGEAEVQSALKGPLDTLDSLEDSLPIRRGISKFYRGKSKSFTSLADVSSSSVKDLAKPENSYTRKRKNLLAFSSKWEKTPNDPLRSARGSISKKPTNSRRSTVALTATLNVSDSNSNSTTDDEEHNHNHRLPPPHPHGKVPSSQFGTMSRPKKCSLSMRSFSMTDLQDATTSSSSVAPGD